MKQENLAVLLGYLANQLKVINRLLADIRVTDPQNKEKTSHLGYQLHNLYGALEDLFQEIARTFENRVEDSSRYHRELLKRMALEIPGIRPAVLSAESHSLLNELRGFRHVFRHAYDYELAPGRLRELKARLLGNWPQVEGDLKAFQAFLSDFTEES
jgi:uncharacterized protein YutE (UPF0331/DUF86 family)